MEIKAAVIEPLIAAGIELFTDTRSHFPHGVPRYNILGWLFCHCQDAGIAVNILERDRIVEEVHAEVNKVMRVSSHHLTVAQLRECMVGLPENVPVLYQRIEDLYFDKHHWKVTALCTDMREASAQDIEWVKANPHEMYDLVERDGKTFVREKSGYIPAFAAWVATDDEGRKGLCINAHY